MSDRELFPLKSERTEPKDLKGIINQYLQYWYLFVLGAVLSIGTAYVYLRYYAIPLYSISSTILIKDDKAGGDLAGAGGLGDFGIGKSSKNINNEIEVLLSKTLMERVIAELSLNVSYFIEGRVRDIEVYGKNVPIKLIINSLDSAAYGRAVSIRFKNNNSYELEEVDGKVSQHEFGQQVKKHYATFTVVAAPGASRNAISSGQKIIFVFQDTKKVADYYNQAIMIYPNREDASVLRISLTDPIPEKGKSIINKLIEVYNKEAIEDKNIIATSTIDFLDDRLQYVTIELTEVEKDVEKYKRINELTDVSTQASNYLEQASDYNKQLSEWAIQIDVLESIERYLSKSTNQYKLVPSTLNIQDPTLLGLISKFNELQLERERILRTTFPDNPLVLDLNEQLANLSHNILENLKNIKEGLVITSNNLKASSGQFKSRISKVPSMERELLEINRQQSIKQNLYLYLLQKREESAISLASNVTNSRIIDPAMSSDYPISPNSRNIYLISLLLGLGLPFGIVFFRNLLNDKVQDRKDVEQITGTPILGELSHNNTKETLLVKQGSRIPIVEMFRLIRTKLHFAAIDKENKIILVTSGISGEGKTFFSINLAASLVLTGKKVVLLELDLRNPKLLKGLNLPKGLGITDYLVSTDVYLTDLLMPQEEVPGLYVVGAGPIPPDPAELMMSPKLAHLISELKESFDHVIIDSAPVGQVADAFSLSPLIDSTIYLVRYNYTLKKQIELIEDIYRNKLLRHPLIVMNDAKKQQGERYVYSYGYYQKDIKKVKV